LRFGIHFVPTLDPAEKSAEHYFDECLDLCRRADALGFHSAKITEHYLFPYGGYCPDPVAFLSAAAQHTSRLRLSTGGLVPAYSHPVAIAGKLAMLDNLSHGRLDAGFSPGFLPEEFDAFEISLAESRWRFEDGVGAVKWLWQSEEASWSGRFHTFGPVRSLPRPVQVPHPPIWITATFTPVLFEWSGRQGFNIVVVPYISTHENNANLVNIYRRAWRDAGHVAGAEQVQLTFHCYLAEQGDHARREARPFFEEYTRKLTHAADAWSTRKAEQYPGYENIVRAIQSNTYEHVLHRTMALIGSPNDVIQQIEVIRSWYGEHEATLQFNFGNMPFERARRSLELFAEHVMPRFAADVNSPERDPAVSPQSH
jgi:alkanesulfonate monooxygenase SsuD/methylene tetrahydromethanopterin reductase-like flavin-dependent oxidoreductase (luciferase family)